MELIALPAFADNYIWMIHDGQAAVVVDPADASPVMAALSQRQLRLEGIVVTHHHPDHIGGIAGLALGGLGDDSTWLVAPDDERIPDWPGAGQTTRVSHGHTVSWRGTRWNVIHTPGHTRSHLTYWVSMPGQASWTPVLMAGDALFSAGCGRLFEGGPEDLLLSMQRLSALPGETRLACAHEYTLSNLRFAQAVERDNIAVARHFSWCQDRRAQGLPTLPSTLAIEAEINPFWRHRHPDVVASALLHGASSGSPQDILGALRQWKNGAPA
jgi:hydroxyacylglutathione hydrolase